MDKKMSNEEMVKEAVEEAKKAAEAEAKEQEPEDAGEMRICSMHCATTASSFGVRMPSPPAPPACTRR